MGSARRATLEARIQERPETLNLFKQKSPRCPTKRSGTFLIQLIQCKQEALGRKHCIQRATVQGLGVNGLGPKFREQVRQTHPGGIHTSLCKKVFWAQGVKR